MKSTYAVLFSFILSLSASAGLKGSRPNIIFVMTDDQGSNLSCMGHPIIETPHIDQFAGKSLRLKEFHVSPTCAPTRAALMSGRHEFKNGVTHTVKERELMALSTITFPQLLQEAGYETGIFGKWHLGDPKPFRPAQRGFSESLIHGAGGIGQLYPGSCADFPPNAEKEGRYFDNVLLHNETVVQTEGYCTDVFFRAALGWMKKNLEAEKPFFAYIAPNTPHAPLIAPKESYERIAKRHPELEKVSGRFAMIENIDDNFGLMMGKLREWDALDNTLIIFTTDNGAPARSGGKGSAPAVWNAGYKSGKGSPGEGGTHVPCFWYWKGRLPEGQDVHGLTAHIDLYKTFCDLAGASIPGTVQQLDGRSLLPLLENPGADWADRKLFIHAGRWDKGMEPQRDSRCAVRTQRWRLVGEKLYDISNDPKESSDVARNYPEVVENLNAARLTWWEETVPLMINENREWEGDEPPYHTLYKEAAKNGIPDWSPSEL